MNRLKLAAFLVTAALFAAPAFAQVTTLEKMRTTGKVTMGVRDGSVPLSFTLGDGKYAGFHVDICQQIINAARRKLGLSTVEVSYQLVSSQNRIPLVQNGTVDIECGSTTNNVARQKDVAFAVTTYIEEVRMAVRANSGITSISQLNGKTVVTTTGTTSVQHLRKHQKATGIDFKEVHGKDHQDSFLFLESGRADAYVIDGAMLASLIATSKNPTNFVVAGEVLNVEPIAIMMRKDDPELKKIADDTIRSLATSGALRDLWAKWYLQPIPPKGVAIGLQTPASIKAAWAGLNDKPMEDYQPKAAPVKP